MQRHFRQLVFNRVTLCVLLSFLLTLISTSSKAIDYTGLEYLIITAPDFESAADELALWKNQKGITTQVATTTETGTTTTDVEAFIDDAYTQSGGVLSYLLLIGDANFIENYDYESSNDNMGQIASDMDYADLDEDEFPDLAYGRIPVATLEDAEIVVGKILDYEKTPSFNTKYYDTYLFASYFEEDTGAADSILVTGVHLIAVSEGPAGNAITIQFTNPSTDTSMVGGYSANQSEVITVVGTAIAVQLGTDSTGTIDTTAGQMVDLINADASASALVTASVYSYSGWTAETLQEKLGPAALSGGMAFDGIEDAEYVTNSEEIYDVVSLQGKTVERKYSAIQPWGSGNPNGPKYFYNGDPLPADLLYSGGYTWAATAAELVTEFNDGKSIIMHRDHGQKSGWTYPQFYTSDAEFTTLANGNTDAYDQYEDMLPVIFSINCASGMSDGSDGFAEQILKMENGGAASVIAASDLSYTFLNDFLSKGLFDTIWDDVATDVANGGEYYRLGDMLNYALLYIYAQGYSSSSANVAIYEYEVFGDPTLEVWSDEPKFFDVSFGKRGMNLIVTNDPDGRFPSDIHMTLFQNDVLIATGQAMGPERDYVVDYSGIMPGVSFVLSITAPGYRPFVIEASYIKEILTYQSDMEKCYQYGGPYFADADGDGFGNHSIRKCAKTTGYIGNNEDCDDAVAMSNPETNEICGDAVDNNCSHWADEGCDAIELTYIETTDISSIDVSTSVKMTTADIDGDGMIDLLAGDTTGTITHYEQSTANTATFTEVTENFNGIDVGSDSDPTVTDIDGDGLLDLLIGTQDGTIWHYEQDSAASGSFSLITNIFQGIDLGMKASPAIADLDHDDRLDLFVGDGNGNLFYYEQDTMNAATFTAVTGDYVDVGTYYYLTPEFGDLDNDGLIDLVMGSYTGGSTYNLLHYEQTSPTSTDFVLVTETFAGFTASSKLAGVTLVDIEGDGYLDLLLGTSSGKVDYHCSCH